MKNYFYERDPGLDADIERHRHDEERIKQLIADLGAKEYSRMSTKIY